MTPWRQFSSGNAPIDMPIELHVFSHGGKALRCGMSRPYWPLAKLYSSQRFCRPRWETISGPGCTKVGGPDWKNFNHHEVFKEQIIQVHGRKRSFWSKI
jgi:hypothetical protein